MVVFRQCPLVFVVSDSGALYESWILPVSVLLGTPVAVAGGAGDAVSAPTITTTSTRRFGLVIVDWAGSQNADCLMRGVRQGAL